MPSRAPRRATLEDVARMAGVSRSTASRVIAGYGAASPIARDRVVAAATQLGYAPDPAARALATGAGVRLVVAVVGSVPTVLHDPYVDRVVRAAAEVCARRAIGVSLEWLPLHTPGRLRQLAEDRGVRGVLLVNTTELILAAVPAALEGRTVSIGIGSGTVPSFDVDNGGAARSIVGHLVTSGRRRIAMISGPDWMPCTRRPVTAYQEVLRAAGLAVRSVPGDFTATGGEAATLRILEQWPDTDAIFANSDAMALGVLAALRRRGVDVPGDIAVAGFDDVPFAALSAPALTTASHPVEQIATSAARAVLDRAWVPPATAYPSDLILRESA
ncbi:LacI family DNA-binding transcriptional regulator [Plantactinospora sp. WMMB782]|uniref:LacI family DNA-binding transcriptional regulator n=1 Tax=Plantactinospora sp. WMMB782 TaxID=3404121 RepID=UPI003B929692